MNRMSALDANLSFDERGRMPDGDGAAAGSGPSALAPVRASDDSFPMSSRIEYDSGGLEILDAAQCRALLATAPLGRIVFTDQALPAVQPVNFALHGDHVIIRTSEGSKLDAATRHAVVAFEADDFDPEHRAGWSVVLIGPAEIITDPEELAALRGLPLTPWAPGRRDRYIRITPEIVRGRRIT